jgi:hypothetical protein
MSLPGLDGGKPLQFRQGLPSGLIVSVIEPSIFHHDGHEGDGLLSGALKIKETNRVLCLSRGQRAGIVRMLVELQRFKGSIFFSMVWPAMPSFSIGRQVRVEVGTAISDLLQVNTALRL